MSKRALLIASSFDDLKGPRNDIRSMESILRGVGFNDMTLCEDGAATRQGIIDSWHDLTGRTQSNDTVVVYYSGHGGLVTPPPQPLGATGTALVLSNPRQFIVPTDYNLTSPGDFRGILDAELSVLLREVSAKTANVTLILDCCHSGSIARDPVLGLRARQRSLGKMQHHSLLEHQTLLEAQGQLCLDGLDDNKQDTSLNQAVRVFAATAEEKAWEYANGDKDDWAGAMTRAFVQALGTKDDARSTWRATLARVRELVGVRFPQQHPHVEGPVQRLHFELDMVDDLCLPVNADEKGDVWLSAGKLREVYKGNVYAVLPAGATVHDPGREMAKATVQAVEGFKALVTLSPPGVKIPPEGAVAFLERLALPQLPVAVLAENQAAEATALRESVQRSKFLCLKQDNDQAAILAEFRLDGGCLVLRDTNGVVVLSQHMPESSGTRSQSLLEPFLKAAEQMARAHHLLALTSNLDSESKLNSHLEIQIGVVKDRTPVRQIERDGTGRMRPGENMYIRLKNQGRQTIYVSVFSVNVAGAISRVQNRGHTYGIPVQAESEAVIGESYGRLNGMPVSWPRDIAEAQSLVDSLVFIQTDAPVDLGHLEGNSRTAKAKSNGLSRLEQLTDAISTAESRDVRQDQVASKIHYAVDVIRLTLDPPQAVTGGALPTPEEVGGKIESLDVSPRVSDPGASTSEC